MRLVAAAHARGIQLHAWMNALSGWGAGSATSCALLRLVMRTGSSARLVYIGLAASRGTAQMLQQIDLGRRRGVTGFSIYSYSSITPEMRAALSNGPFARPARVPVMSWR